MNEEILSRKYGSSDYWDGVSYNYKKSPGRAVIFSVEIKFRNYFRRGIDAVLNETIKFSTSYFVRFEKLLPMGFLIKKDDSYF